MTRKSTNVTNLTLSRRPGETVVLDGPGTVRIVHSSGRRVKLIIAAPAETRVLRGELCISSAATIDEFGDPA